jgi:hypothetical protein
MTVSEHGFLPENGERFLEGFVETHPEVGPVVSQNTQTGSLSVTISFDAEDIGEAAVRGTQIFIDGAEASGLEPPDEIEITASVATAEQYDEERELQPA